MTLYLTPEKYRTMGFGIDLEGIEDVELASIMARASSIADGYCTVPRLPMPHSFIGGIISFDHPEQHQWRLPESDFDVGSRRVYPYHWPILDITKMRIKVTNTQYLDLGPNELFLNNTERYIEVISLAYTGVGLFGAILPSIGLMRPVAEIAYTYGYHFPVVGEILYATDARTYRADQQFWDTDPAPKVYVGGTIQTSGYSIDYTEGTVLFDAAPAGLVTVDYAHRLPREIKEGVAMIATHLLGEREQQARGMTGVKTLKVDMVSITNADDKVTSENLAYIEPEAAWLLDGFKFWTVR